MRGRFGPVTRVGFLQRKGVGMRLKIASSLLIVGSGFGCYVQPYNPPPAQYGQAQPQPGQPPPQPQSDDQQAGYAPPPQPQPYDQQPPVAQPAPPPAPPPSQPSYAGPIYDDVKVDVAGNNVPSVDVFYNDLAPYGSCYNDPTSGGGFSAPTPSVLPYSYAHWDNTDYRLRV